MYPKKYIITFCLIWPLNFHTFIFHEIEFFTSKKIIDIGSGGTNKIKENYSYTHWTFLGVTNRKNKSMKWPCSLTYNNYFSVNSNFYSSEAQTVLSTRKKRLKIPWLYILRSYKTRLIIISDNMAWTLERRYFSELNLFHLQRHLPFWVKSNLLFKVKLNFVP